MGALFAIEESFVFYPLAGTRKCKGIYRKKIPCP